MMLHDPLATSVRRCIVHHQQMIHRNILAMDGGDHRADRRHPVKIHDTDREHMLQIPVIPLDRAAEFFRSSEKGSTVTTRLDRDFLTVCGTINKCDF